MKAKIVLGLLFSALFIGATFPQAATIPLDWRTETERATALREPSGLWVIRAELPANTPEHLEAYRSANAARLRRLLEAPWPGPIPVQITFRSPLSLRAVRELLDSNHLELLCCKDEKGVGGNFGEDGPRMRLPSSKRPFWGVSGAGPGALGPRPSPRKIFSPPSPRPEGPWGGGRKGGGAIPFWG